MSYDLSIRPKGTEPVSTADVLAALRGVPGCQQRTDTLILFEPDPSRHAEFDILPQESRPGMLEEIGVAVPYPFLASTLEPALLVCVDLAERFDLEVTDAQTERVVSRDTLVQVLGKLPEFDTVAGAVLSRHAGGTALPPLLAAQSPVVLVGALLLASVLGVAVVVWVDPHEANRGNLFIGATMALWALLLAGRALLQSRRPNVTGAADQRR